MQEYISFDGSLGQIETMLHFLLVESDINNKLLENALSAHGTTSRKIQYSDLFISYVKETNPDIIIFNLDTPSEKLIADLHKLSLQSPLPVIMFARDGCEETIHKAINADVCAYIVDDISSQRLDSIVRVALARFKQIQTLKTTLEEARTQLEDRKQIDRAKAILIKTQHFSEDEAYHKLRKLAMDRNITLGEMARNVIAMAELLK
jgi:response regulator NasT